MRRFCILSVTALLVVCFLSGCALVKLRADVQFSKDSCLLFGEIISHSPLQKPIIVVAYTRQADKIFIGDYAILSEPGPYELLVRQGAYRVFAFEDANNNLAYDKGEWVGHYNKPEHISALAGGVVWGLDIEISNIHQPANPSLRDSLLTYSGGKRKPTTSAGSIISLDNPALSEQWGERGFWAPLEFFKNNGCNVYFLEPYDPKKIPIVFVHGAAGSPQDWKYFIKNVDRDLYQPWVFHYPSGARLQTMSLFLRKKLYELHQKYAFEQLYVVAHSMGGLVSRSAIMESDTYMRTVKLFISISTPWGGEQMAKTGVENSPAVIPSWKDMQPNSDFIRYVFARKIPQTVRYYLLFGHKGGGSFFRQNNDNTVTLESMLDPRAQGDALKVVGFNEDHISILNSAEVFAQYKSILASTEDNLKKTMVASNGYVDLQRRFLPADTKMPLHMAFVLIPAKTDEQETQLKVNPFLARQETSPVAPGNYEASLCALGFKTEPVNYPVAIKAGKITEASFTLMPQGMVAGLIVATTPSGDSYWGFFRDLPEQFKIRTINLTGAGINRSLTPANGMTDKEVLKTFLASKDYSFKNQFAFFNLPAGDYTLSINADGCEPFSTKMNVQPGEFVPPPPFKLITK